MELNLCRNWYQGEDDQGEWSLFADNNYFTVSDIPFNESYKITKYHFKLNPDISIYIDSRDIDNYDKLKPG